MKWYWTPGGLITLAVAIGFFAGAIIVKNETLCNFMIVLGFVALATSWVRTYLNIKRIEKEQSKDGES